MVEEKRIIRFSSTIGSRDVSHPHPHADANIDGIAPQPTPMASIGAT